MAKTIAAAKRKSNILSPTPVESLPSLCRAFVEAGGSRPNLAHCCRGDSNSLKVISHNHIGKKEV